MTPAEYRKITLEILEKLNPGRVFHIKIDFDRQMRHWSDPAGVISQQKTHNPGESRPHQ